MSGLYYIQQAKQPMRPLLLAGVLLLSTLPAYAEVRVKCGQVRGMDFCVTDTLEEDTILILGPKGGERINVNCTTGEWRANGPNSQQFVESTVNLYCAN